jgi:hypothetical protein
VYCDDAQHALKAGFRTAPVRALDQRLGMEQALGSVQCDDGPAAGQHLELRSLHAQLGVRQVLCGVRQYGAQDGLVIEVGELDLHHAVKAAAPYIRDRVRVSQHLPIPLHRLCQPVVAVRQRDDAHAFGKVGVAARANQQLVRLPAALPWHVPQPRSPALAGAKRAKRQGLLHASLLPAIATHNDVRHVSGGAAFLDPRGSRAPLLPVMDV